MLHKLNEMKWGSFKDINSLSLFALLMKYDYKQKCISHSSGNREVQGKGAGRQCLVKAHFLVHGQCRLAGFSHGGRHERALWGHFVRASIPITRAPP
jgi:hypothetical protein